MLCNLGFFYLQESIVHFGQHAMDKCMETAKEVIDSVRGKDVPNGLFLMAKAHYIISAVYRQDGDFDKAQEHMVYSTEVNKYNSNSFTARYHEHSFFYSRMNLH